MISRLRLSAFLPTLLAGIALVNCNRRSVNLPDYGAVPHFEMTDSQGAPFASDVLRGKVWIADFIYTNCPGVCPLMTSRMHTVARKLVSEKDIRLVSISVDPGRDTPPILNAFAHRYGAPTPQWMFLTGTPQLIHLLAYQTFHVGDVITKVDHSSKLILVDKRAHIRGYYSSFNNDDITSLLTDAMALCSSE